MPRVIPWPEHARLRAESERIRADTIRGRIAAAHAFCSVLQTEARWESSDRAQGSMGKVWRAIAELKDHLAEPGHVPTQMAGELLQSLARLEERVLQLQESLQLSRSAASGRISGPAAAGHDRQTSR